MGLLFTQERIAKELARGWLAGKLELRDAEHRVVRPVATTPELSEAEMEKVPGALAAWRGVGQIPFETCEVSGTQIIIKASWCTEMATAPNQIAQAFADTKAEHEKSWQAMLSAYVRTSPEPGPTNEEPEPTTTEDAVTDLQEWANLEALQATATITQNVRANELSCNILMDDKGNIYALDSAGTRTVPKYSYVGGFGGGTLVNANPEVTSAIPFTLPEGDRSIVQLTKMPGEEGANRPTTGTVFTILRSLEMKGHHDIEITKYGKAKPETQDGQRCYTFPDAKPEENFDYVLNANAGAVKVENFFKAGARREGFAGGVLTATTRLLFDPVGNILRPGKAVVVTNASFELNQGKPRLIAWYVPR